MGIARPADGFGLWTAVEGMVEWPETDEDVVAQLATGWAGARDALTTAATGVEGAGRMSLASWPDQVGQDYSAKVQDTGRWHALASGMGTAAARASRFEQAVRGTKTEYVNSIAANAPLYGLMSLLPEPLRTTFQNDFAAGVATNLNGVLAANADAMSGGPGDDDEDGFFESVAKGANNVGEGLYEAGEAAEDWLRDTANEGWNTLDEAGLTPGWLDDLQDGVNAFGEKIDEFGDGIFGPGNPVDEAFEEAGRQLDGVVAPPPDPRLAVAVNDSVAVDDIQPTPVWRDSAEPLYRVDARNPEDIFKQGFGPRDATNVDLGRYVFEPPAHNRSAFVGTTRNPELQRDWPKPTYRYTLIVPGGIDVEATLANIGLTPPKPNENEIAFPGGVKLRYIAGAYPVDANGKLGDWIQNPKFDPVG
ncbi:hypothetical protein AB0M54_44440 [Actinoplanes sp. NPDC051470]|uniref:scabin-related ADP-ribosyltransferase n=1 Tax=Actinoplanes sp. NPDC051470 TaxID=3157224 RepID=UPI003413A4C9